VHHELEVPGRELCQSEPGYVRYVVIEALFREQLARLEEKGIRGISVTEALRAPTLPHPLTPTLPYRPGIAITFDDGSESDLIAAAPALKERGFNATFYAVPGLLGQRGYLSERQLRELSDLGFEIGSHSMTHAFLTDLDADRLHIEIVEAKDKLEQLLGRRVDHFACPGGRWNRHVSQIAELAGYRSVATSRIAANPTSADPFRLARLVVERDTTMAEFEDTCSARRLLVRQVRVAVLSAAKGALGNAAYEKVRSTMLGRAHALRGRTAS
jgi:peptidoglycan/xylan/chitin deacetylase (PgdA/CDA1 family)